MPGESIRFAGTGGAELSGVIERPAGPQTATAIFAHCFTCSKNSQAARRISARLAALGIAVLRFDFTGIGASGGAFEETTFSHNADDLTAAARYLTDRGMAPSLMIGHSLGGAAVLRAAGGIASVRAVATIGAPFDPGHVTHNFEGALDEIATEGSAEVRLGGHPIRIGHDFVRDVEGVDMAPVIRDLKRALLILHAPRDATVGIDNAAGIFGAARHPKSFVTLDEADHLLTRAEDAEYAAEVIATWAARYLDLPEPDRPETAPEGVTRVTEADPKGFLQDISVGLHHILADEPAAMGGADRGLTPYGLVTAGLGACTSMTLRMYARHKGLALDHVQVDVFHDKVHGQDAAAANTRRIDRFQRRITLTGNLSAAERARLMEIADRCPVHRTLENSSVIETSEVRPDRPTEA